MQELEKQVRGDVYQQLDTVRRDMEENFANITEANLKLSQPYAACRGGKLELELADVSGVRALRVYQDGEYAGSVQLS